MIGLCSKSKSKSKENVSKLTFGSFAIALYLALPSFQPPIAKETWKGEFVCLWGSPHGGGLRREEEFQKERGCLFVHLQILLCAFRFQKRDENVCLIVHLQMRVLVFQAGRLLEPGEAIIVLKITTFQSVNSPTVPTFHLSLFIRPPGPSRDPRISLSNCPNRDRQNLKRFDMINWMNWLAESRWWHDVAFIMIEFSTCDESDTSVSDNMKDRNLYIRCVQSVASTWSGVNFPETILYISELRYIDET